MYKWTCANNIFGFCRGEPKWSKEPIPQGVGEWLALGECSLDHNTCKKFVKASKAIPFRKELVKKEV